MSLENYKEQIYSCGRCGYCVGAYLNHVCPSRFIAGFDSATAKGRMLIARAILEGKLDYSERLASMLFTCTLCGACEEKCKLAAKINITEITKAMRSGTVNAGIELEKLNRVITALAERHNVYNKSQKKRAAFVNPNIKISEKADLLYFPGCTISYRYPKIAQNTLKVLDIAGIDWTVLGENEWCCGYPLLSMGMKDLAEETTMHNIKEIRGKEVKTVLTSCPSCYRMISQDYPRISGEKLHFQVVHMTQFLDELIREGIIELKNSRYSEVTYHDPCDLGRQSKIYEEPRNIIQSVPNLKFVEMSRNRENAWCCGGGGSVNVAHTYSALKVAELRIEEAQETGTNTLVTACPSCIQMLELASKRKRAGMNVIDISELVLDAAKTT